MPPWEWVPDLLCRSQDRRRCSLAPRRFLDQSGRHSQGVYLLVLLGAGDRIVPARARLGTSHLTRGAKYANKGHVSLRTFSVVPACKAYLAERAEVGDQGSALSKL